MRRPSFTFYVILFTLYYVLDISFFWYVFLPFIIATGIAAALRRYFFETVLTLPVPPGSFVVISGTSSGFGADFVATLVEKGFIVLAGVRKIDDGENLIKSIKKENQKLVIPVILDVTKQETIDAVVLKATKMIEEENKNLYAIVNNAGIQMAGPLENLTTQQMREIFDVNVFGLHSLTRSFLPLLRRNKGSRIVNIGSIVGLISSPFMGFYTSTKHALEAYSDSLRIEVAPFGVYVTLIEPGSFKTAIFSKNFNQEAASKDQGIYTQRWSKMLNGSLKATLPESKWIADQLDRVLLQRFPPARALFGLETPAVVLIGSILPDSVTDLAMSIFLR
jgi:short-subunit dehydrogenase